MSYALTALRLATIAALNSHPVLARECQGRIYDSAFGDFKASQPIPVIVVTTEELKGEAYSRNNGGLPFNDHCNLCLEIALRATLDGETGTEILVPAIDGASEARLNRYAWCADVMLTQGRVHPIASGPTPEGNLLVRQVLRRVPERSSARFATDETGVKFAIHLLTYRVELKNDAPTLGASPTDPYAVLPDPLRTVARAAKPGSYAEMVCKLEAAALAGLLTPPRPIQSGAFNPDGTGTPVPDDPVTAITFPFPPAETP